MFAVFASGILMYSRGYSFMVIIALYILLFIGIFIIRMLVEKRIKESDSFSKIKNNLLGLFIGFLKVGFLFAFSLIIFEIALIFMPGSEISPPPILNTFKNTTRFINYSAIASNLMSNPDLSGNDIQTASESKKEESSEPPASIEGLANDLKNNETVMEIMKKPELVEKLHELDLEKALSNPAEIINLMREPELRALLTDPEIREIIQNQDINEIFSDLKKIKKNE
ncbi:MAG: hypothetical protein ACQESP_09785 [Candidatus Muiribacteriota bacterium]